MQSLSHLIGSRAPGLRKSGITLLSFMLLGVARAQVEKLPCDYQENPLAMDATAPRLSWRMKPAERGQRQTAYQILVATSAELLPRDEADVFTRHYDHLKRWIHHVRGLREDGIVIRGYGDWCPPDGRFNYSSIHEPPATTSSIQ
jgi:hypothetical protein